MNNEDVMKMVKAGLSEDIIITAINASPGLYDTTAEGLVALKSAGAGDKVVSAVIVKASGVTVSPAPAAGSGFSASSQESTRSVCTTKTRQVHGLRSCPRL